jgi:hypothetical protein
MRSSDLVWGQGISQHSIRRWCRSVSILIGFALNLRREFGDFGSQDSRTASCTGNPDRTLKYLWSPLIVGAPTIGWAGFNGSFHRRATPTDELQRSASQLHNLGSSELHIPMPLVAGTVIGGKVILDRASFPDGAL